MIHSTELPSAPRELSMLINGERRIASDSEWIERTSPAHEIPVTRVPRGTSEDVAAAVGAAREAFDHGPWPHSTAAERSAKLLETAGRIREAVDELALLETLESGKPITQARFEVEWTAGIWEYAGALARHVYGDSSNNLGADLLAMTLRDPIGVVGIITPWNFPMLIISQSLPFALAAGCTTVVKPSELTSATTIRIAEILKDIGLPDGVVNVVTGYGDPVGRAIAESDDVDMVSFTGSSSIGKSIVRASAGNLKKVTLELGGKNPLLIFNDADLESAVDASRLGAYFNMGECCNSSSRILVQDGVADDFVERFTAYSEKLVVGDPLDEETKIGAIINQAQYDKILGYLAAGKDAGAQVRLGGGPLDLGKGRYIQTTVLDAVPPQATIAREEIFGPVLSVIRFRDADEAVQIANGTPYGLSAGLFTNDYNTALTVSRRLRAGTVWVNSWLAGYNELSFGGYKESGLGRQLGRTAIEEFTEAKTVQLHLGKREPWW